jgi:hypothetical protein
MTDPTHNKPGFEEIALDISVVPTVEQGLDDAAERYQGFAQVLRDALGDPEHAVLFEMSMPLLSFTNRAASLHAGIVSAVKEHNPHAAFTLLRAYLELVVLVRYVDLHPDYMEALRRPMAELPKHTRKRWDELFEDAATEMRGVRRAYEVLSEMAHFGSTALWHPFTITDAEERLMTFGTGPHWKHAGDPRIVLAMLREADEAMFVVLDRFLTNHVTPSLERFATHGAWAHAARAMAEVLGGSSPGPDEERGLVTLPAEVIGDALERGLVTWCDEHQAPEVADGVKASDFEAWVEERLARGSGQTDRQP